MCGPYLDIDSNRQNCSENYDNCEKTEHLNNNIFEDIKKLLFSSVIMVLWYTCRKQLSLSLRDIN